MNAFTLQYVLLLIFHDVVPRFHNAFSVPDLHQLQRCTHRNGAKTWKFCSFLVRRAFPCFPVFVCVLKRICEKLLGLADLSTKLKYAKVG